MFKKSIRLYSNSKMYYRVVGKNNKDFIDKLKGFDILILRK